MKDVDLLVAGTDHRPKNIQKYRLVNSLMRLTRQDRDQREVAEEGVGRSVVLFRPVNQYGNIKEKSRN